MHADELFTTDKLKGTPFRKEKTAMDQQTPGIRDLFMAMPQFANTDAIQGVNKIIQFNVSGEEPGQYYITVYNGQVLANEGVAENPDVTISTPSELWMEIATGKQNGAVAFMTGKFKAQGDLGVLMSMQNWFKIPG
jgi:putative sterol carrier protein